MDVETTNPTVPDPEAPALEVPVPEAPASKAPAPARQGNALLAFLTVLLVLVGIADVILWGVAGWYFLRII